MTSRRFVIAAAFLLTAQFSQMCSGAEPKVSLPTGVSDSRLATEVLWHAVKQLPVGQRPRIILVLGGGGARGLSHIGVLKVLEEEQIPVDQVIGVSVGALIGSLYAGGLNADQIKTMANEIGWNRLTNISKASMVSLVLHEDLFSNEKMETYLEKHIGNAKFSDLKIPFVCVATDIRTGERIVFQEGPVSIAARASATIPGIFHPVEYQGRSLVDGGLVDNLPADIVIRQDRDVVIGVLPHADEAREDLSSIFRVLVRSIEIQKDVIISEKKKMADYLIEPNVGNMSLIDLAKVREAIVAGTIEARKNMVPLKNLIISRTRVPGMNQESKRESTR